ncbi:hypothetical protein A2154_01670 [Candidatus Gottesmanbacteria bacterium RBG_16_43_7]|uniref:2TM domain-containing protein n=1 Tax=Candidatus Gottesmanbacteria bacterium RBG_16_43_7 TaxID=1798373 RepID=A0A1F5ZCD9_9BACT|nr:MAG: hypothetical protein A2154_01670 [Candidatus Gottesmanbacteria bacterium RBG_16_43_7]
MTNKYDKQKIRKDIWAPIIIQIILLIIGVIARYFFVMPAANTPINWIFFWILCGSIVLISCANWYVFFYERRK